MENQEGRSNIMARILEDALCTFIIDLLSSRLLQKTYYLAAIQYFLNFFPNVYCFFVSQFLTQITCYSFNNILIIGFSFAVYTYILFC